MTLVTKEQFIKAFPEYKKEDEDLIQDLIEENFNEYDPNEASSYVFDFCPFGSPQNFISLCPRYYFEQEGYFSDQTFCPPMFPSFEDVFTHKTSDIYFGEECESTFYWEGRKKVSKKEVVTFLKTLGFKRVDCVNGGRDKLSSNIINHKIGYWLYDWQDQDLQFIKWKRISKNKIKPVNVSTGAIEAMFVREFSSPDKKHKIKVITCSDDLKVKQAIISSYNDDSTINKSSILFEQT